MFVIRVDDGNGLRVVETTPWTIRQWEMHNKTRLSKLAERGFGMDDYMFLAWRQLKDENVIDAPFDKWAPTLKVCEIGGEAEDLDDPNSHTPSEVSEG